MESWIAVILAVLSVALASLIRERTHPNIGIK
jgi:hypothetical protein